MPKLMIIVASTRPGRVGRAIADWFAHASHQHGGFDIDVADLAEIGLPFLDEPNHPSEHLYVHQHTKDWAARVDAAHAFVIVMPEYNAGFTAPLKNAIDFLYTEWHYKPVGFVSYGMTSAGLRAVQMIKPVITAMNLFPVTAAVTIFLRQRLDETGALHPDAIMTSAAEGMLQELHRIEAALRPLRESSLIGAA